MGLALALAKRSSIKEKQFKLFNPKTKKRHTFLVSLKLKYINCVICTGLNFLYRFKRHCFFIFRKKTKIQYCSWLVEKLYCHIECRFKICCKTLIALNYIFAVRDVYQCPPLLMATVLYAVGPGMKVL